MSKAKPFGKKWPMLFHKGKGGAMVQWLIWTEGDTIYTEHGQVGGKLQRTPGTVCVGKNIGRSNETSPAEQAQLEAQSMWTYKVERKYSETMEDAEEEIFLPMLAKPFKDDKKPQSKWGKGLVYPVDIQPKLDGVRAMAYWDGDVIVLGTRNGKEWVAPLHIMRELQTYMPKEMVLDGELYIHGVDFESLSSWTKKIYPDTSLLEYHVFDMPIDAQGRRAPWKDRRKAMDEFFQANANMMVMVKQVPVTSAKNLQEVLNVEEFFLGQGYEGAMARNLNGEYLFGHRSNDLQKVKSSVDSEFKIVDFTNGVGKFVDSVIWICENTQGAKFRVVPKAPMARREQLYREAKSHVGEWLKVVYQNLTADSIPRFPRSVGFRDEKDMDKKKKGKK